MGSKRKKVSKKKTISKFGFASPKIKQLKYHETFMVINGKVDKTVRARFTKDELKRMSLRAKKYSMNISDLSKGLPISGKEWESIDERTNWDEYEFITKSGKKIRLLANMKESDMGITRADPSWKPRKKKVLVRAGQTELVF
jgi:hypothetical protein